MKFDTASLGPMDLVPFCWVSLVSMRSMPSLTQEFAHHQRSLEAQPLCTKPLIRPTIVVWPTFIGSKNCDLRQKPSQGQPNQTNVWTSLHKWTQLFFREEMTSPLHERAHKVPLWEPIHCAKHFQQITKILWIHFPSPQVSCPLLP